MYVLEVCLASYMCIMKVFLKVCTIQVHTARESMHPFLLTPFALQDAVKHPASLLMYSIFS